MSPTTAFPSSFEFAYRPILVAPAWANAFVQAAAKAVTIATVSQQVIAMRLTMLATGGNIARNRKEVERMFTEKVAAVQESSFVLLQLAGTMAQALPTTLVNPKAAERMLTEAAKASDKALGPFHRRVTANHKRLAV